MAKQEFTCEKCKKTFDKLSRALDHAQTEHGMTNRQRAEENALHRNLPAR